MKNTPTRAAREQLRRLAFTAVLHAVIVAAYTFIGIAVWWVPFTPLGLVILLMLCLVWGICLSGRELLAHVYDVRVTLRLGS